MGDDELMTRLLQRSQLVGPFDPVGSRDMMQCLMEYWRHTGTEKSRQEAVSFGLAALHHGDSGISFKAPCWGPPELSNSLAFERLHGAMKPKTELSALGFYKKK